jgi:hypothetical protein
VVPFPAGGSVDAIARLAQPLLQQKLGTTVLIENRSGGSGSIGAASVAKSIPDGLYVAVRFDTQAVDLGSKGRTGSGTFFDEQVRIWGAVGLKTGSRPTLKRGWLHPMPEVDVIDILCIA